MAVGAPRKLTPCRARARERKRLNVKSTPFQKAPSPSSLSCRQHWSPPLSLGDLWTAGWVHVLHQAGAVTGSANVSPPKPCISYSYPGAPMHKGSSGGCWPISQVRKLTLRLSHKVGLNTHSQAQRCRCSPVALTREARVGSAPVLPCAL